MNNKGTFFASILVALFVMIAGFTVLNFIKTEVSATRLQLNCAGTPATDGTKIMCLSIGIVVPYFIIVLLGIVAGLITEKFMV